MKVRRGVQIMTEEEGKFIITQLNFRERESRNKTEKKCNHNVTVGDLKKFKRVKKKKRHKIAKVPTNQLSRRLVNKTPLVWST